YMVLNLIDNPWLPAMRADGCTEIIRPAEITSAIETNPIVAIDWPRADFRVACLEFLIGLVATACPPDPDDEDAWIAGWASPPSPGALADAVAPIAHAFNLDGPGPRFLQDFEELPGESDSPETLLIEAPGESTRKKNTALLVKPGRVTHLSRPAAAMALFTMQCYAPAGGRGNLTSVRGGGPLTTLVLPGVALCPLWKLIWANVPPGKPPEAADLPRVFPWLAPTRTADRFPATTPKETHPLQAFWGMPRRIRLDFAENPEGAPCDLTGIIDPVIVTGWRQRPNGIKYAFWEHPLSPSYKDTKSGGWLPVHPQPGGIGYRDWVAIVLGDAEGTRHPARCIREWRERSHDLRSMPDLPAELRERSDSRLFAAGYDMDNMKARGFVESEMPLPGTDPENAAALASVARHLAAAAAIAAQTLRRAVREALYNRDTKADSAPLASVHEAFWAATQDRFFSLLRGVTGDWETALKGRGPDWRNKLRKEALRLFDEAAPLDPAVASFDPARIVKARCDLFFTLEGYRSNGERLFAELLLTSPAPKGKRVPQRKGRKTP
ncbi:MAG: type I-E CRISPR-associated protein Cse1/CasA, partial [Stellaceae bacterium]